MTPQTMAGFLGWFQRPGRNVPIQAAEALLWIASGVDTLGELRQRMNAPPRTVERTLSLLRGRARYREGRWIESPYGLVTVSRHPDRRGNRIALSPEGRQLVQMYFGTDALPSNAATLPLPLPPHGPDPYCLRRPALPSVLAGSLAASVPLRTAAAATAAPVPDS